MLNVINKEGMIKIVENYNFTVGEILHVIEREANKEWNFNGGSINRYIIVMILSGIGICEVGGKLHTLCENDILLIPPHTERVWHTDEDNPCHFISLGFELEASEFFIEKLGTSYTIVRNVNRHVRENFKKIMTEWNNHSKVRDTICRAYVQEIMCHITLASDCAEYNPVHFEKVENAKKYINQNYMKNITVEELAEISGLSTSHFRKVFREIVGISSTQYAIQIRINKAKDLLSSGSANVSEAAFASGFNDIYYFSAMFKKVTGENPSKYNK